jgi:hypothetical protein
MRETWEHDIFDRFSESMFNYPENPCILAPFDWQGGCGEEVMKMQEDQ